MSEDRREPTDPARPGDPAERGPDPGSEVDRPTYVEAVESVSRFSREFLATVISLLTTAFGVVVALAWNTALSTALARLSAGAQLVGLFVYALAITGMAVVVIIFLGRLAGRIGAQPIEFKYPARPAPQKD
ncbi:MAG: hypothetical protein HY658_11815 [Actinobacteria bacterium]|nr:hypothetical protein [Actinomycetota bacterium]